MKDLIIFAISFLLIGCISESESKVQIDTNEKLDSIPSEEMFGAIDDGWIHPDNDTDFFSTGSFLYWQTNSDSSWLTFESKAGEKIVVNTDYIGYWDKLGTLFRKEYDDYLFFIHRWISGCCTMPDFILMDKNTGKEIKRINSENGIYASEENDFFLYFKDSSMNEMIYLDLGTNETYRFDVRKFKLQETAKDHRSVNSAEFGEFINYPQFLDRKVTIVFDHLPKNEKGEYDCDSLVFTRKTR